MSDVEDVDMEYDYEYGIHIRDVDFGTVDDYDFCSYFIIEEE